MPYDQIVQGHRLARTISIDAFLRAYVDGRISLPRRPARPVVLPGDAVDYGQTPESLARETAASRLAARLHASDRLLWRIIDAERWRPDIYTDVAPAIDRLFEAWAADDEAAADAAIADIMVEWDRMKAPSEPTAP